MFSVSSRRATPRNRKACPPTFSSSTKSQSLPLSSLTIVLSFLQSHLSSFVVLQASYAGPKSLAWTWSTPPDHCLTCIASDDTFCTPRRFPCRDILDWDISLAFHLSSLLPRDLFERLWSSSRRSGICLSEGRRESRKCGHMDGSSADSSSKSYRLDNSGTWSKSCWLARTSRSSLARSSPLWLWISSSSCLCFLSCALKSQIYFLNMRT